jgi:hypothetical protein
MANNSMAPVSPNTVEAAVGAARPLLISLGVSETPNAMADRPNVVAMVKGIANQARPPVKIPSSQIEV